MAPHTVVNWAIYNSLPPGEAQYQLAHVNDSKRVQSAIAYTICLSVTFLAVVMRFLSRRIGRTEYGADDWVMVLGLVIIPSSEPQEPFYHMCRYSDSADDRF